MHGRGTIGSYHNRVASDVDTFIDTHTTFYPPDQSRWYNVRDGEKIDFELVPVYAVSAEVAMRRRREDKPIHKVYVFPLSTPSSYRPAIFWVSWHETWKKVHPTNYNLLNAGWTMFKGLSGNPDKDQVLRVDWDQLPHKGSPNAGHPHWHFDHELFLTSEPDKVEVAPGLVEVTTDTAFGMPRQASLGFIHLAMGAWNKDKEHPECWQRTYEDDCQQLRDWCVKTLRYLKEQVGGR
jgi:hypothetical protein